MAARAFESIQASDATVTGSVELGNLYSEIYSLRQSEAILFPSRRVITVMSQDNRPTSYTDIGKPTASHHDCMVSLGMSSPKVEYSLLHAMQKCTFLGLR